MKRYKWNHLFSVTFKGYNGSAGYIKEEPNGEWVKWEDVKDMVKIPCTCEEMADKSDYEDHPNIHLPPFWICPAHGYKRR